MSSNKSQKNSNDPIEAPEKEPELLPRWECHLSGQEGKDLGEITVGDLMVLKCRGEFLDNFRPPFEIYQLLDKEKNKKQFFDLHPLDYLSASETDATMVVTSYRVGKHQSQVLRIEDTKGTVVETSPLNWTVKSVIEEKEPKPFGAIGPLKLSMPWWFWASIIIIAVLLLVVIFRKVKKKLDRKQLIEELGRHGTALSPFNQLNKDLRKISRQLGFFSEKTLENQKAKEAMESIEKEFRMYLVRELKVPANLWSDKDILKDVKSYHSRVDAERGVDISRLFHEFDKARSAEAGLTMVDCKQMIDMVRLICEGIHGIVWRRGR